MHEQIYFLHTSVFTQSFSFKVIQKVPTQNFILSKKLSAFSVPSPYIPGDIVKATQHYSKILKNLQNLVTLGNSTGLEPCKCETWTLKFPPHENHILKKYQLKVTYYASYRSL